MIPTAIGLQSYVDEVVFGVVMLMVVLGLPEGLRGQHPTARSGARRPWLARFTGPLLAAAAAPGRAGSTAPASAAPARAQPAPPAGPRGPRPAPSR